MFITFEGPEGSGKTTQFQRVVAALQAAGVDVLATREPGGTLIGEQVRDILLNRPEGAVMAPEAEALLFSAARAQHVREVIRPALAAGRTVLCDRFYDSTLAYQGYGHGLDLAALRQITAFATGGLKPDITIYLDCPPEVGLGRKQSQAELNRLDRLALDFHRRVYAGYQTMMQQEPERWVAVDATPGPDEVFARITAALHLRGLRL
ncbi:MAG: dTMP kinase [Anaerolineae bacterium]|nr:dTMP kinase [Anaerolineae bacterium]